LIAKIRPVDRHSVAMTAVLALNKHPYLPGVLVRYAALLELMRLGLAQRLPENVGATLVSTRVIRFLDTPRLLAKSITTSATVEPAAGGRHFCGNFSD
jgi:hypothetical protein